MNGSDPRDIPIENVLSGIIGNHAWDSKLGHGTFVTVNFGEPSRDRDGVVRGKYYLWVYFAPWVVFDRQLKIADSDDSDSAMQTALSSFEGSMVTDVTLDRRSLDLRLNFANGIEFWVRSAGNDASEAEHWMLFMAEGWVISAGPSRSVTWEPMYD